MSLSFKTPDYGKNRASKGKRRELGEEQKQEIKEAFNLFDTDKDQAIDYHELKARTLKFLLKRRSVHVSENRDRSAIL